MKPAYQKVTRHVLMWLLLIFTAICGQLGIFYVIHALDQGRRLQGWGLALSFLPFIGVFVFGIWRMTRINRARLKEMNRTLEAQGFLISIQPKPETKASFWQSMESMAARLEMNRGAEALQWLALRGEEGERMAAWEYQYVTGSGKSAQIHEFTSLAWPQNYPGLPKDLVSRPATLIQRLPWLERRARRKQELMMPGLETFGKDWSIYGDADTAAQVLNPAWLSLLARSPKGECWHVGDGWVCACFWGKMDAENFAAFLNHAEELRRSLQ